MPDTPSLLMFIVAGWLLKLTPGPDVLTIVRHALRQVRHVQRARDAVEHRGADEEQRRGRQVDGDVVQARLHPRAPRAVQQQAVGRGQQDLEEHEQVEQVGREEGAR